MVERRPNRTLGPGHDEFWTWCEKGELRLQRCGTCGHLAWPVEQACEQCGAIALDWERMSGRGRIVAWSTFRYDYYGGVLAIPYDTILVELAEGPLFVANPFGFDTKEIVEGMAVTVAFIDCEDDAGRFRLPVFERS